LALAPFRMPWGWSLLTRRACLILLLPWRYPPTLSSPVFIKLPGSSRSARRQKNQTRSTSWPAPLRLARAKTERVRQTRTYGWYSNWLVTIGAADNFTASAISVRLKLLTPMWRALRACTAPLIPAICSGRTLHRSASAAAEGRGSPCAACAGFGPLKPQKRSQDNLRPRPSS
jgi:hypothetical protein